MMANQILNGNKNIIVDLVIILTILCTSTTENKKTRMHYRYDVGRTTQANVNTKTMCMDLVHTLRAKHKTCFLRPDTGPCRADIIQWYYDVKRKKCYRFFWGGCQGNGNKFDSPEACKTYCFLNNTAPVPELPHFCSLAFDYGSCFGHYNRWAWDSLGKTCKRRLYSGCGGNQNNFETLSECLQTCLTPPNNTLQRYSNHLAALHTTCFPFNFEKI